MRLLTLIVLSCVLMVAIGAPPNPSNCKGKPSIQKCEGPLLIGTSSGRRCRKSKNGNMWHYNVATKKCTQMKYNGCGGNSNRWCSKADCEAKCPR